MIIILFTKISFFYKMIIRHLYFVYYTHTHTHTQNLLDYIIQTKKYI